MRRRHLRTVLAAAFAVQSSLLVLQPAASNAAANPGVDVLAVRSSSDHDVSLVAALHPMPLAPLDRKTVTATAGGADLPTDVTPVLSGRTGIGLVIDASADGAAALHDGGLSGAAGFLLQMPPGARTAVVADRRPPAVAARTAVGVSAALQATSGVTSTGARATSEALTLSVRQLPAWPGSQPVLVLFTAAPDAGGEAASALGERLQGAHAILAVITTSADSGYWSRVATSTGGFAISTRPAQAITAFDAAADALRARYQVTFTRPRTAATQATLRFDAAGRQTVVAVALPRVQAGRAAAGSGSAGAGRWLWVSAAALLAAAAAVAMLLRRRPRPGSRDPDDVRPEVSP
jgi:hypothetical protein